MEQTELWKDIKDYEGKYQISNFGRVKSITKNTILTPYDNGSGYLAIHLYKNGRHVKYIHRLVAETFIGDIGDNDINHKDFDRKNNNIDNLEICSRIDNIRYSQDKGRYKEGYKNRSIEICSRNHFRLEEIAIKVKEELSNGARLYELEKKYNFDRRTLVRHNLI